MAVTEYQHTRFVKEADMAGIGSKIAKTAAGAAAAAGFYYAGKKSGLQEAAELQASDAENLPDNETGPTKSAYASPTESPEAFHAALNDRADSLRERIYEKAFAEGSIEERFDRIVGVGYMTVEQAEIAVEADQAPSEEAVATADQISKPEAEPLQETPGPEFESNAAAACADAAEEAKVPQDDEIDWKNAKTGDLDPYHRIQKALSNSEFFEEDGNSDQNPPEFTMP